jgi:hypothetical protein
MSFTVSALTDYSDEQKLPLILKAQLGSKTASMLQLAPGIKSSQKLNLLDTTTVFQANGCGFNASGTTTLSQRTLTVGDIKVNEELCPKTLATKWTQSQLKAGTMAEKEVVPFEKEFTELKAAGIASSIETGLWQGDTGSGTANLNKFDGLIKIIDAAGTAVNSNAKLGAGTIAVTNASATVTGTSTAFSTDFVVGDKIGIGSVIYTIATIASATSMTISPVYAAANASGLSYKIVNAANANFTSPVTAFSSTTAQAAMFGIYQSIPVQILDKTDVVVFMGMDYFRTWQKGLSDANLFHYTGESSGNFELVIPGTNVKAVAVNGLNSTNRMFAMSLSNGFYGVDLLSDSEDFKIWYSQDDDIIKYKAEFRAGVQVAYPSEIVQFTLA